MVPSGPPQRGGEDNSGAESGGGGRGRARRTAPSGGQTHLCERRLAHQQDSSGNTSRVLSLECLPL